MSANGDEQPTEMQREAECENETHRGFPGSFHLFLEGIERVDGSVSDHSNHRPAERKVQSNRAERGGGIECDRLTL
jgi:hypothetical protein